MLYLPVSFLHRNKKLASSTIMLAQLPRQSHLLFAERISEHYLHLLEKPLYLLSFQKLYEPQPCAGNWFKSTK
uniref:Uncharacterized protein n=1 Tax=Salmonella sp. TaxID=599 RepID=A0A482ETU1_SALSP|nr:hypothetical protein NNIBIDOC_00215 [Salmonella sp.]